jgi:uncharacterized protein
MVTDDTALRTLVYGGAVLGGGGGGSLSAGLASVREALSTGAPRIVPLDQLPDDATLVTLSAVGFADERSGQAPSYAHFKRALDLFASFANCGIDGFIASEVGALAVTYGLQESAHSGIPVVDAPCNGRAHPLFVMGSLGLHRQPTHPTTTVAVGGRPGSSNYVEIAVRATVGQAARVVRDRVAQSGIALAVVRNPVSVAFVRRHAAVGGLAYAHRAGCALLAGLRGNIGDVLGALVDVMGGYVLATGCIVSAALSNRQGFTMGRIELDRAGARDLSILVCNEFMAVFDQGRPVAFFPDLITVFDRTSRLPLTSTEAGAGRSVAIFIVPRGRLILGSTMRDPALLEGMRRLLERQWRARPD